MRIRATDVVIRHAHRVGAKDIVLLALSTATFLVAGATGLLFLITYNLEGRGFEYGFDSNGELVVAHSGAALLSRLYPQEPGTEHGGVLIERCLVLLPYASGTLLADASEYVVGLHVELVRDGSGRYRTVNLVDTIGATCRLGENATVYVSIIHADRTAAVRYDRGAAGSTEE